MSPGSALAEIVILLDTNALPEILRKKPHAGFMRRLRATPAPELATSTVCVFELRHGAARRADAASFWKRIETDVLFRVDVLPFGDAEAVRAGDVLADLERAGTVVGIEDLMIGSTALVQGARVVRGNIRHLTRISGLVVEDWWS